jgi:hypothetical protein
MPNYTAIITLLAGMQSDRIHRIPGRTASFLSPWGVLAGGKSLDVRQPRRQQRGQRTATARACVAQSIDVSSHHFLARARRPVLEKLCELLAQFIASWNGSVGPITFSRSVTATRSALECWRR